MRDYMVTIKGNAVFLFKEDQHFAQKLKERVYRYDEQMKGEKK